MARMGRPPKPIEQKRRTGNPGNRPLPEPVEWLPSAPAGGPPMPADLSDTGQRFWQDVWQAGAAWLSPAIDLGTVELAARMFDDINDYRRSIDQYGRLVEEPMLYQGEVVLDAVRIVPNPAVKMLRDAEKSLLAYLIDLGFTPTARARLGLAQVKAQSKLEQLSRQREERARQAAAER